MKMNKLREELKRLYSYDPNTGMFTRLTRVKGARKDPMSVGWVDGHGYAYLRVGGRSMLAHRAAWLYMLGDIPALIDHADRNKLNNAWFNLRSATKSQNARNSKAPNCNSTGIKGLTYWSERKLWRISIRHDGGRHQSAHKSKEEAIDKLESLRSELHGYFACSTEDLK
jgi:hypothetical protein